MNRVTARHLAVLVGATFVLAGCTSGNGSGDGAGQSATTTTTIVPTTTESVRQECLDVADRARALFTEVGRFASGDGTLEQVRAAADELSDAFETAKASLGPDAQADLDSAGQALQRAQDALAAQPVDSAALRTAATEVVAALGNAATVCAPGSSTAPTDTTSTDTSTVTDTETATVTTTP